MLAHVDAGKTTLTESLLYSTGAIRHLGRVDNRDTFLDTDSQERARGITIFSKQARIQLGDRPVTLMDTPGHVDFSSEMERTLQILDYAILVISGADGVQSHTDTLWQLLKRYQVPVFIFVNKMDQSGTNRARLLEQLKNRLSSSIVDFNFPDYEEIALCDEALLERYLAGEQISTEETAMLIAQRKLFPAYFGSALKMSGVDSLIDGLSTYICDRVYDDTFGAKVYKISRDATGSRLTHMKLTGGTLSARTELDGYGKINQIRIYNGEKFTSVSEVSAGDVCAVTGLENTYAGLSLGNDTDTGTPVLEPVLTYQLIPEDGTDPVTLIPKLRMLEEEDPELHIVWNELTKEIHIQVMGMVQIEILTELIKSRFGVDVTFGTGRIVYKETIANTVEGVGHFEPLRHYAEVHLLIEPLEEGSGIEYELDCPEDTLSRNWQRLVLTHLCEKTHRGVLTGSPLTDVRITLVAGRAHLKHTVGGDFRQATYRAVRQGLMQAESVLLEPYYEFNLELPTNCVGRAMTDFERMCGSFTLADTASETGMSLITGIVPVSSFKDYQLELNSYTKGLGKISCRMAGYKRCHNTEEVLAQRLYDPLSDTRNPCDSVFCAGGAGYSVPWDEVFSHMHIESVLAARTASSNEYTDYEEQLRKARRSGRSVSDEPIGTDEIDAILKSTYYSNSKKSGEGSRNHYKKYSSRRYDYNPKDSSYKGKEVSHSSGERYLLVDGYNVIHAWKELDELAAINMDGARGRLLDILCNYQAMTHYCLIVVFDAYRVKGHDTEILDYHNIHVVYTKEAETADRYIEKFAHEHGRNDYVRVATSDGQEQIIIIGQGCTLVSAREFEQEVKEVEEKIRKEYLNE
jgi:small GTP-binding protein